MILYVVDVQKAKLVVCKISRVETEPEWDKQFKWEEETKKHKRGKFGIPASLLNEGSLISLGTSLYLVLWLVFDYIGLKPAMLQNFDRSFFPCLI